MNLRFIDFEHHRQVRMASLSLSAHLDCCVDSSLSLCVVCRGGRLSVLYCIGDRLSLGYLVDPASSHMLVSKIKPCMSKYKRLYCETANGSLNQLWFI